MMFSTDSTAPSVPPHLHSPTAIFALTIILCAWSTGLLHSAESASASSPTPFEGEKSLWHGFDRYDFLMDESSLAIQPADPKTPGDVAGQRRCMVVVPKEPATGRPWSWRGCYWDHEPQTEMELLKRGFHIAYITANASLKPDKKWDAWYEFLTQHGLSQKPAFIGMSRGGEYGLTWATAHPDKVSCIYADNPGGNWEVMKRLGDLATNDVPLLLVSGSIDPLLGRFALPIETIYQQFGGRVSMMIKEGAGHHPHSLRDPKPIVDFITQSVQAMPPLPPSFVGEKFTRTSFYGPDSSYRDFPTEGTRVTCRGPEFTPTYAHYAFDLAGVEGPINVIVPNRAAHGTPWVFRAGVVEREATVDLALLAKGFHIVIGPVPYNADGPIREHWDAVYQHFTRQGFSLKPVMEGAGGASGEVYAWAVQNSDKVSCVYAENPVLRSQLSQTPLLDHLAPLAKAGVPLLHVCGSLDPWLESQTRVLEKRYKELGGEITVIIKDGDGHYPLGPEDVGPVLQFISRRTPPNPSYSFDKTISRPTLENYLSRAISMEGMLNGRGHLQDNIRMLTNVGAKYIGRALCLWGAEVNFLANVERAKEQIPLVLAADPEIVLEACVFETVSARVNEIAVPGWVFAAFGLPVEQRTFRYDDMIYPEGQRRPMGRNAQVPDESRLETRLWFYYQAATYIDIGCEAIHFGQVEIVNRNDRDNAHWEALLSLVRQHAAKRARRHMVLCNGHVPTGGLMREGRPLLDFHAFPLRVMEVPDKPQEAILKVGFSDGLYGRSKGGLTFSGWTCDHLPYLAELDNYGVGRHPGQPNVKGEFLWVWGYDEITWFAHQSRDYRAQWLRYARDWVRVADTNAFLQMPGSRTATSPETRWYFANKPSPAVPTGLSDEDAIRALWAEAQAK